jgi:geranylgeranyl pyrophosphate synthase
MEKEQLYQVPTGTAERKRLRKLIDRFAGAQLLVPPLSLEDLSMLSDRLIADCTLDPAVKGWIMVEINNCIWRETVASIPYSKRILLLPKCLSHSTRCQADVDELGLLCHRCNRCSIPDLQDKAERLGMMSLVAEGFTSVIGLIENRVVDTVIGVSCLDSLEKAFPLLINHAVPGLAIPLNKAGCRDTDVDYDYVGDMIEMLSDKEAGLLDYDHLKSTLKSWFSKENLATILSPFDDRPALAVPPWPDPPDDSRTTPSPDGDPASRIAREWLAGDGKRWRPYLLVATYLSLRGGKEIPRDVQLAAMAVECFHKASLVHDDIQDNDTTRYGKPTVNAAHGIPVAINVGDILLGEGYRLLTDCGNRELIRVIADSHIALCKGQGMELEWSRSPGALTLDFVLDIFCNKTVPAFDVSLTMGVICAGDDPKLRRILRRYARALGIAYQLQDDLEDFETEAPVALRPSAVLAKLCEQRLHQSPLCERLHGSDLKSFLQQPEYRPLLDEALRQVRLLAAQYRSEALDALRDITNVELKRLLFRVTRKILTALHTN